MKDKTSFVWLLFFCLILALTSLLLSPLAARGQPPDSITLILETPAYELTTNEDGFDSIQLEGFDRFAAPGDPDLPGKVYNIAVPPDIAWDSLTVEVLQAETIALLGTYEIGPAPPFATWVDGQQIIDWGKNAPDIVDGKNTKVYQQDAYFPETYATVMAQSQMRKWRFVRILFTPVQYNPITKQIRLATEVEVRLTFERRPVRPQDQTERNDTVMDDRAARILYNHEQAKDWYQPDESAVNNNAATGYVIITTNQIANRSLSLEDFIAHKQAQGYTVEVVTEDDYGGLTGQPPNGTAEKIRQWLINNYLTRHIEYVLLIGDPDPDDPADGGDPVGDAPMKMCWPRFEQSIYRESPTDYFYADLTGNWDLDGDGYFGEYIDDGGSGGVDFAMEVYVGRIPVYTGEEGWRDTLDNILQKIMAYENAADPDWRKTALLPMSFSDAGTDGAYLAEQMKSDYLNNLGYTSYTLYQQSPSCSDSIFSSNEPLLESAVRNHWQNNPYGLVTWWGHGNWVEAAIGYSGCGEFDTLLASWDTPYLKDSQPAFVYQNSCSNGYPEYSGNLGYALLKQGAIGTVSASRVSWYFMGTWIPRRAGDNASIGYYYMGQLAEGQPAGKALYDEKSAMEDTWGTMWMNFMDFNLYGDPSTRLMDPSSLCNDPHETNNSFEQATTIAYGTTITGIDICSQGDEDYYVFSGSAGDFIIADINAEWLGSDLDSYLTLYDANRNRLIANDNSKQSLDSYLVYRLPADGLYYLKVAEVSHPDEGGPGYFYTLTLSNAECGDLHEPNNIFEHATEVAYGTTVTDVDVCPQGDVDYYVFSGSAGDFIVADIDAEELGSDLDSHLTLYDADGNRLTRNDDEDAEHLDSHIEYTLPADDTYYLRVREAHHPNEGGLDYFYTLSLEKISCIDPYESNDTRQEATSIAYDSTVTDAKICPQGDVDYYVFSGDAGDQIVANIDAENIGSTLDSYLILYDSNGQELTSNDDDNGSLDSHIEYTLPTGDTYYLMVRAFGHPAEGNPRAFYALTLSGFGAPRVKVSPTALAETVAMSRTTISNLTISNWGKGVLEYKMISLTDEFIMDQNPLEIKLQATGQAFIIQIDKTVTPTKVSKSQRVQVNNGLDTFGYIYQDSTQPGGPTYDWIEIAPPAGGSGTELTALIGVDDGYYWPLDLPFNFNFYGVDHTQLAIASNGILYFEDQYLGLHNTEIPGLNENDVARFIAPLWDDLTIEPGAIYYQAFDSMFVVEFYQVSGCCLSPKTITWEIILFKNGNILFQYKDVVFGDSRDYGQEATVGIQGDLTTGLQYSYNSASLSNELAILFSYPRPVPWLSTDPIKGTIPANSAQVVEVTFDATAPDVSRLGEYEANLIVSCNDPLNKMVMIPVTMTVIQPEPPLHRLFLPLIMK